MLHSKGILLSKNRFEETYNMLVMLIIPTSQKNKQYLYIIY